MIVTVRPEARNMLTVSRQEADGHSHPSFQWFLRMTVLFACSVNMSYESCIACFHSMFLISLWFQEKYDVWGGSSFCCRVPCTCIFLGKQRQISEGGPTDTLSDVFFFLQRSLRMRNLLSIKFDPCRRCFSSYI